MIFPLPPPTSLVSSPPYVPVFIFFLTENSFELPMLTRSFSLRHLVAFFVSNSGPSSIEFRASYPPTEFSELSHMGLH